MTKLIAPLLGFDAEGSIGKEVTYSQFKGVTYAKQYKAPRDPRSPAQVVARDTMAAANSIWKNSPDLFREPWNRAADSEVLSGYNAWIGRYMKRLTGEANFGKLIFAPPVLGGLATIAFGLVAGSGSITFLFNPPGPPTGWFLQAVVGGAILSQPPNNVTQPRITMGQAAVPPGSFVMGGLLPSQPYICSGWLRWIKSDGKTAWGQSKPVQPITTLP